MNPQPSSPIGLGPRDIERQAGVPTTAPNVLSSSQVKSILGWDRVTLDRLERAGILKPLPRRMNQHRQYWTTDVARVVVLQNLDAAWERLED